MSERTLLLGDCRDRLRDLDPASVDAIVTDPPYGIEFLGREWDRLTDDGWRDGGGFSRPGIGDRETDWPSYGSETANPTCGTCNGRARGADRCGCETPDWRVKGEPFDPAARRSSRGQLMQEWHRSWAVEALRVLRPGGYLLAFAATRTYHRLASGVEDAGFEIQDTLAWLYGQGFPKHKGLLKPGFEPVVVARNGGSPTIRVEDSRIGTTDTRQHTRRETMTWSGGWGEGNVLTGSASGRWPANVALDEPAAALLDEQAPETGALARASSPSRENAAETYSGRWGGSAARAPLYEDERGGASRFFYVAKASSRERKLGLLPTDPRHPTVKPVALMRWLIGLVSDPGDLILDPFLGHGSTGMAAAAEGRRFVGIEMEEASLDAARSRIADYAFLAAT